MTSQTETKAKADSVREAMRRAGMILAEASAAAEADRAASDDSRCPRLVGRVP